MFSCVVGGCLLVLDVFGVLLCLNVLVYLNILLFGFA